MIKGLYEYVLGYTGYMVILECKDFFLFLALDQCGPLSLVEVRRDSAGIGRELHSVAGAITLMA